MSRAEIAKSIEKIEDLIQTTETSTTFHSILAGCYKDSDATKAHKFVDGLVPSKEQLKFVAEGHKEWFDALSDAFDRIKDLGSKRVKAVAPKFYDEQTVLDHNADFETEKIKKLSRVYSAIYGILDVISIQVQAKPKILKPKVSKIGTTTTAHESKVRTGRSRIPITLSEDEAPKVDKAEKSEKSDKNKKGKNPVSDEEDEAPKVKEETSKKGKGKKVAEEVDSDEGSVGRKSRPTKVQADETEDKPQKASKKVGKSKKENTESSGEEEASKPLSKSKSKTRKQKSDSEDESEDEVVNQRKSKKNKD